MSRAEAVLPPLEDYLIDLCDEQDYATAVAGRTVFARRGGGSLGANFSTGPVWDGASGWLAEAGARNLGMVWAAASSAAATLKGRSSSRWQLPIGFNLTGVPAVAYWPLRYRLETILWRTNTPSVADQIVSFVCSWTGGTVRNLSDGATFPGYELVSDTLINGGRWTPRWRMAGAGALTTGADSGIDPAGVQTHLELRYDHTTNPRLSFLIDGVELPGSVRTGLAEMPVGSSSLQVTGLVQGRTVGGGVGQLDRQRQTRFRVQQLVGFPI